MLMELFVCVFMYGTHACNTLQLDTTKAPPLEVKEPVYSEADDGKPKPIPASEFPAYFKSKSSNGAAVLQQEFKARR